MDQLNHLGWVAHRSYEVARVQFGVRTNSEACAEWLDATFWEYEVDERTAPYYSILFGTEEDGQVGKPYHILYEESRALVRTHDLRTLGEVLIGQFEHVGASERDDAVFVDAAAVQLGDVVALVPPIIPPYLGTLSRRVVDRTGLRLPGVTYVALEPESGRVVPVRPTLDVPLDALDRLGELTPASRREVLARVEAPLRPDVVCFIGLAEEPVQSYSKGRSAHLLATKILNLERVGGAGLEAVSRLVAETACYEIRSTNTKDTLATLVELLATHAPGSQPAASNVAALGT